jgi:hypothetical protein
MQATALSIIATGDYRRPGEHYLSGNWAYDWQAPTIRAKRDGWGISQRQYKALANSLGKPPSAKQVVAEAVRLDFACLAEWCNGLWHWVCVSVYSGDELVDVIGGIASDDLAGISQNVYDIIDKHLERIAKELVERQYWAERDVLTTGG